MSASDWPNWYCQVCGEADGENAENCCDCADHLVVTDEKGLKCSGPGSMEN